MSSSKHHQPPPSNKRRVRRLKYNVDVVNNRLLRALVTYLYIPRRCLSPRQFIPSIASSTLYLLGPLLVVVTFSLLSCLSWTFWNVIIPLRFGSFYSPQALIHQAFVLFVLVNILFNYILCVCTKNRHGSLRYNVVVKQLARATGFSYPETLEQMNAWRQEWRNAIIYRTRQRILQERYHQMHDYDLTDEEFNPTSSKRQQDHVPVGDVCKNENLQGDGISAAAGGGADAASELAAHNCSFVKKRRGGGLDATAAQPTSLDVSNTSMSVVRPLVGRSWMSLGPHDWSYCDRTQLPKPPRSHYDHVTQSLVLNMDHYCPWMFNCIGYFNYRYFVNFLIYVAVGMMYGAVVSFRPFIMIDSSEYREQIMKSKEIFMQQYEGGSPHENDIDFGSKSSFRYSHVQRLIPNVPIPREATPIAFSFMMCFAVGLSVVILLGFHLYLIVTAQTTIEFHANRLRKKKYQMMGEVFCNPYDLGIRRNMEQVWGRWGKDGNGSWFLAWTVLLPSMRENEFLPIPIKGDDGLCEKWNQIDAVVADVAAEGVEGQEEEEDNDEDGHSNAGHGNYNLV